MANTTNTPAKPATRTRKGKAAPAPAPYQQGAANAQQPQGTPAQQQAAPQAPLYVLGTMPPVRPGTHRAYAQQVARTLAKAHPNGFTLAAYRAALVANAAASNIAPPTHGWAKHNMPTWAAGQGWLVPA